MMKKNSFVYKNKPVKSPTDHSAHGEAWWRWHQAIGMKSFILFIKECHAQIHYSNYQTSLENKMLHCIISSILTHNLALLAAVFIACIIKPN